MTSQFDGIYHGLSSDSGKFRMAASGMAWKGKEDTNMVSMSSENIKWAQWLRVARGYQLRVGLKDRSKETFDGFNREDHDKLQSLLKQHFGITLENKEVTFKGWNWGATDFQGQDLVFLVSNKTAFELPLNHVANSNIAGRTEVSIEFNPPTSKNSKSNVEELTEIRFFVPGTRAKDRGSDAGSQKSDAEDDEEVSAAKVFHDTIKERADLGQVTGDIILSFEEVLITTPRGRYDVDMFPDFMRMRGKTYDYKILYSSISKLFLLPKDDQHVLFILALTTPIRQGQTKYQYLVMQFAREEETTAELNMSEEEVAKYEKLKKNYEDPTFEVVSGVFRALSGKKIIGSGNFQSRNGMPGIKANLKAVQGDLFFLEKYIFFVSKAPTLIEISDIHQAVFSRVGVSMGATAARTFDLKIITKSGPELTFSSINKEEHEPTENFLKEKKIKLKNEMVPDADLILAAAGADDDESMGSGSSDDDGPRKRAPRGSEDDSETDEDFEASESDAGSPSDTDDSDSGAETASDASGDREMATSGKGKTEGKKKKAKAKQDDNEDGAKPKKKTAKKAKAKDDDAMDVDDDEKPKERPKPKPKAKAKDADEDKDEDERPKKKAKVSE